MWSFPPVLYNRKPSPGAVAVGGAAVSTIKVPAISIADKIIASAKSIVGQKEIIGNKGFKDPKFEARMKAAGWKKLEPWCVYTAEDVWDNAMKDRPDLLAITEKLFSGSATATFANFKQSPHFKTGSVPKKGAIVIWRYGNGWTGHAAVVIDPNPTPKFDTVEGNTNASGGREGIEVAEKIRQTGLPFKSNGLNLLGFIYPPEQ